VIPGYEVLGEIGRGGMGVVYKARQVALNRLVALKRLIESDPGQVARLRLEAEALARLRHPNIVQVLEVRELPSGPVLCLEFCAEGSLERRLASGPLPAGQAAELVRTVAQAVQAAHAAGIVHRDLKPGNVLLVEGSQPKVSDFGLAKKLDVPEGITRSGVVMGTPSYMAPEQARGRNKEIGPATDVYALGAILYECLTGRPPFKTASPLDTLMQVIAEAPVPPRQLNPKTPRDLETVCLKCLHKDPQRRYPTAGALAGDLRNFLDGRPIVARPVSRAERAWRWCRRNPAVAALAGTLAAVLIAGLATVTLLYLQAEAQRHEAQRQEAAALAHLDDANQQRDEATRQKERSEASYRIARAALEKVVKLRDDPRLRSGPLEDLQRQIARAEADFYQEFLRLRGDDPTFQAERARAFAGLSSVAYHQGKMEDALRHIRRAIAIDERLHKQSPAEPARARRLADDLSQLALVSSKLAHWDEMDRAYRRSAEIYQGLLARDPNNLDYLDAAATAQQNLGVGFRGAGRLDQAEQALRAALALWDRRGRPRTPREARSRQMSIGVIWSNLAEFYTRWNRPRDATAAHDKALAAWQELSRQDPGNAMYRMNLAGCYNNLGLFQRDHGHHARATASWEKAIALFDGLVAQHPTQNQYAHALAMTHDNLGMLLADHGPPAAARPHYDKALALWARLHAENPTVVEYVSDFGYVQRNLGNLAWRTSDLPAALRWYARAISTLETSPDRHRPGNNSHTWLRDASWKRAMLLARLGRYPEALRHWDRVVELERGSRAETRLDRAEVLAGAGLHARAVREAEFLAGLPNVPAAALYRLAAVLSLCLPAVEGDASLPEARRNEQVERLTGLAVGWLRRMARGRADIERWLKDPDLKPLRSRPKFQKLIEELRVK
jgi:serine/threonine-protein kinase